MYENIHYYYIYEGDARHGLKHGVGKVFRPSEMPAYSGEFKDDKYDGNGCIFYGLGDQLEGKFSEGMPSGKCIYTFKDGSIITGNFIKENGGLIEHLPDWSNQYDQIIDNIHFNEAGYDEEEKRPRNPNRKKSAKEKYKSENLLFCFSAMGKAKELHEMLSSGDFNTFIRTPKYLGNETLLHIACRNGCIGVVRTLLTHGVFLNLKDEYGFTPEDRCIMTKNDVCHSHLVLCQKFLKMGWCKK